MPNSAREIENLLYTYAERIDSGDLEGVATLFSHGKIMPGPDAPPEAVAAGQEAVLAMYRAATRLHPDGTPRTKHITTNAIIEVEDHSDTASARSYFTVLQQTDVLPLQPIISGRYHDTFTRVEGKWWFETRTMRVDLVGNLKEHLLYELP
jgi:3-phenylpropionate/cinnamic acid dioxygenase small subunit